jgi:hypothetical protein
LPGDIQSSAADASGGRQLAALYAAHRLQKLVRAQLPQTEHDDAHCRGGRDKADSRLAALLPARDLGTPDRQVGVVLVKIVRPKYQGANP